MARLKSDLRNLGFAGIELCELATRSENADNVEEAIMCYLHYGESNTKEIWDDILLGQIN